MNQGFISVPFKAEKHGGLSEVNGIAKFSPAGIVFDFDSKWLGLFSSGVKEFKIARKDILDIKFKKGFLKYGAKIEVRLVDYSRLTDLPNTGGTVVLKLKRDDFERGRMAVEHTQRDMQRLAQELPPPHTPVSRLFESESEDETKELE